MSHQARELRARVCGTGRGPSGEDRPVGRLPGGGGLQAEQSLHLLEEQEGPTGGRFPESPQSRQFRARDET